MITITLELDREDDGRYIAAAVGIPGVMAYGETRQQALAHVLQLLNDVGALDET